MSSISKITRKDGKTAYKVSFDVPRYNNTRRKTSHTFPPDTPYSTVKAFAAERDREYRNGREKLLDDNDITLRELSEIWLNDFLIGLSPSTVKSYEFILKNNKPYGLLNSLGDIQVRNINLTVWQGYIKKLSKNNISPKTIKNINMVIGCLMKLAVKLGVISRERNPMEDVILPKISKRKIEAYTEQEVKEILDRAKADENDKIYLLMLIALFTGARRGEISAMKFSKIDFEKSTIIIDENRIQIHGKDYIKQPKTESGIREIAIPQILLSELKKAHTDYCRRRLKYGKDFCDSGYVFTHDNGTPYTSSGLSNIYQRFLKRNPQISKKNFHMLRHTYCSILLSNNVDLKTVSTNMGHSGIQITANVYAHTYAESKRKAAEKLDNLFNENTHTA